MRWTWTFPGGGKGPREEAPEKGATAVAKKPRRREVSSLSVTFGAMAGLMTAPARFAAPWRAGLAVLLVALGAIHGCYSRFHKAAI